MAEQITGGVNTIVALDPAVDISGGYNPGGAGGVNFAQVSQYSWAFHDANSSHFENNDFTPTTADEAIDVLGSSHSAIVDLFTAMLNDPSGGGGTDQYFQLSRLLDHVAGPWAINQFDENAAQTTNGQYEAVISTTGSGTIAQSIRYASSSPPPQSGVTINGTSANNTIDATHGIGGVFPTAGDDTINGFGGNDTMSGLGGNDTLNGGTGKDTYNGGAGNDIFQIVGTEAQTDVFNGGNDGDTIQVLGSGAVTLAGFNATSSSIEVWQGNGAGVNGTSAANTFDFSGLTNVTGTGIGAINGLSGNDTIKASNFGDTLLGGAGNDVVTGGTGADTITGGAGKDTLTGGLDADKFVYTAIQDSTVATTGQDVIKDFQEGVDKIDLFAIDANTATGHTGNQDFAFNAAATTAVIANTVTWSVVGGNTIVRADATGNTTADFVITLAGIHTLTQSDLFCRVRARYHLLYCLK